MKKKLIEYITFSFLNHIDYLLENADKKNLDADKIQELIKCKDALCDAIDLSTKRPKLNIIKKWIQEIGTIDYDSYDLIPYVKIFTKRLLDMHYSTKETSKAFIDEVLSINYKNHNLDLTRTIENENIMREILREIVFKYDKTAWNCILAQSKLYQSTLIKYFEGIFRNASKELKILNTNLEQKVKEKNQELLESLYIDKLTQIPNINSYFSDSASLVKKNLVLFNIDSFRKINSVYGSDFANQVLINITKKINKEILKDTNFKLYRYHADWFIILATKESSNECIEKIYNKVLKIFQDPLFIDKESITISFTAGIATKCTDAITYAELAFQKAKEDRSAYEIYSDDINILDEYKKHQGALKLIRYAIQKDLVIPYFQLIRDNKNPDKKKYESLMRIEDPYGNVFSPFIFLEVAKDAKLYTQLSKIMMRKSIQTFEDIDANFSINLEVEDILCDATMQYLYDLIITHKVEDKIILEITESENIKDFNEIAKILKKFKDIGVKVAIDDFGTGYSNFSYLAEFDFDYIKIDGSLIKNLHEDKNSLIITSMIVDFAKKLGKEVIAEFIDKSEVQDAVQDLDIDYSQGYLFSKPSPKLI